MQGKLGLHNGLYQTSSF